jgi:hypothetical protein
MTVLNYLDRSRWDQFCYFLKQMNVRGLAAHYNKTYSYTTALSPDVMYFQPLVLAPSDRRMLARDIIGVPSSQLSPEDKVCNASLSYWYGPTYILTYLTGITDTAKAHIDFDRVYDDQDYVESLRANIAFARKHKHPIWTTTELHTSIQTEGRNYCKQKYNDPARKADSLDIVEWMAHLKRNGWVKKVIEAKTLEDAYKAYCEPRGVGPYFGGNAVMMAANLKEAAYSHEESFCAAGGGAIATLDWLFEPMKSAGVKLNPNKLINLLVEHQDTLMPDVKVPVEFQNLDGWDGKILKKDQTFYTANSLEVGLCQCSVYNKFLKEPEAMKRRKDVTYDLTPFKLREQGVAADDIPTGDYGKTVDMKPEPPFRLDLLEF